MALAPKNFQVKMSSVEFIELVNALLEAEYTRGLNDGRLGKEPRTQKLTPKNMRMIHERSTRRP